MRSKASAVMRADGDAPAQADGTSAWPPARAARMKPPIGRLVPPSASSIAAPRVNAGKAEPALKAAQSAGDGAKVLVSCWKPAMKILMIVAAAPVRLR